MHSFIKYTGFILGMFIFVLTAQATEINFIQGEFEQAKALAKKERKLIFVDAYAVWCGPCKMMDRNTFSNDKVADFFNKNFINLKIDVESGEGPKFAANYQVNAMPTLLFLDYNGKVVLRKLGYRGPSELMKEAQKANSPENFEDYYSLAVEEGSNDPAILLNYALIQAEKKEDFSASAQKYFETQSEKALLKEAENWKAIKALTTDLESREFQYLLAKYPKYSKKYGEEVDTKIWEVLEETVKNSVKENDEKSYLKAVSVASTFIKDKDQTADKLKMLYAKQKGDWESFAQRAAYYFDKHTVTSAKELSSSAWLIYRNVSSAEQINNAISWTRQSIALENEYYNNKTLAFLLFKARKFSDAKKVA
ncbi:MAG: thioredoxin family protein, partial [Bacteroidia bacterium]|nr:thioredoxin family protein [Bacteroidia bacterium]